MISAVRPVLLLSAILLAAAASAEEMLVFEPYVREILGNSKRDPQTGLTFFEDCGGTRYDPAQGRIRSTQEKCSPSRLVERPLPTQSQMAGTGNDSTAGSSAVVTTPVWKIIGKAVVGLTGERVGEIEDLVVDRNMVLHAIVSLGGFLGLGERGVAVPFSEFRYAQDDKMMVQQRAASLKAAPTFREEAYASVPRDQEVEVRQ